MPSGPTRDAADRRRWQRLLLISDAVKGVDVLRRCALPDVGVVTYDHERASAEDIARACANKVADADGVKKVDSVALVAPCGDGSVAIARDVVLTVESLLDADIAAFVRGVVALLEPGANAFRRGSRLDFPLLDASTDAGRALAEEIKETFGVAEVHASDDITRREAYAVTDAFMETSPAAAGLRAAGAYFDLRRLEKWTAVPETRAAHPPPPEELGADPVTRRTVSLAEGAALAESAAEADARAVAANAAKRLQTVGRTYAAYFRMRAVAGGDVRGGEGADVDAAAAAAAAAARDARRDDAGSGDDGSDTGATRLILRGGACAGRHTRAREPPRLPRPGSILRSPRRASAEEADPRAAARRRRRRARAPRLGPSRGDGPRGVQAAQRAELLCW